MLQLNTVHLGDCLELLPQVDDKSIDLIITDPPYGINYVSGSRRVKKYGKIANDSHLLWLEPFLTEANRILKPNSHIYVFCSHHNVDVFKQALSKYFRYQNLLVWEKNHFGMGDLLCDYAPQHELILFCSNGRRRLNGKRSSNILKYSKTGNKLHPTEKPVDLIQFLIEKSSNESETVLDPFAGSGTVGVAAKDANRNFILMEKDEKFYEISRERLRD